MIRRIKLKRAAILYKEGKCSKCGRSDGPADAYDFHHLDGKEFNISRAHSFSHERIKRELDKCILVCAFCHRVEHSCDQDPAIIKMVELRPIVF